MEGRFLIKLIVGEAVLKGIVKGLEADASLATESTKSEIVQLKEELICKNELVERLNAALQEKEKRVSKVSEQGNLRLRNAFIDASNEKEQYLLTWIEHEKVIAKREAELSKMALRMVELSFKLQKESKRVILLEKQVIESRETETLTSSESSTLREITQEGKANEEVARWKELHLKETLPELHDLNLERLGIIKQLELAQRDLKEELQGKIQDFNSVLQAQHDNSVLVETGVGEQRCRHEVEFSIFMGLCEGNITDIMKDIDMLRQRPGLNFARHIFKLKVLEEMYLQFAELRVAKAASEAKASKLEATIESQTRELKGHIKKLDKQASLLRRLQDRTNYLELESSQDDECLRNLEAETEDHLWRCDSQLNILITYMEGIFKDLSNTASDWCRRFSKTERVLISSRNELGNLEACLCARNEEADKLRSKNGALSRFVDLLTKQVESCSGEISVYKKALKDSTGKIETQKSESMEALKEANCLKIELEEKLSCKSKEFLQVVDELEEFRVQIKLGGVVLGLAEGVGNDMVKKLNPVERELKVKDEEVNTMRKQVKEQKERNICDSYTYDLKGMELRSSQPLHILQIDAELEISLQAKAIEQEQLRGIGMPDREDQMALLVKNNRIHSLQDNVDIQKELLELCRMEIFELKGVLLNKTEELQAWRLNIEDEIQLEVAFEQEKLHHRDVLNDCEEALKLKAAEVAELLKMFSRPADKKQVLEERVVAEMVNVQKLEEELEAQKWLNETEMDIITFILAEGVFQMASSWNCQKVAMLKDMESLRKEVNEKSFSDNAGNAVVLRQSMNILAHNSETSTKVTTYESRSAEVQTVESGYSRLSQNDFINLRRQNSELRREKEQLSEQRIEEIYKLKRDFYNEFDKFKLQVLSKKGSDVVSLTWIKEMEDVARDSKQMMDASTFANLVSDNERKISELRKDWNSEKSMLLETLSLRDARFQEVSNKLSQALEKERNHVSTRASLVENLAALEKERIRLDIVHQQEREKLISTHNKVLKEKEEELSRKQVTIVEQVERNANLEVELKQSKDEIGLIRCRVQVFQRQLEVEVVEQLRSLIRASLQLEYEVSLRTEEQNSRLEKLDKQAKFLRQKFSTLSLRDSDYLRNLQNLQKAEEEVDLLGDEVDKLLNVLGKAYAVLNQYSPVIQHYPGMAALARTLKHEIDLRIDSEEC